MGGIETHLRTLVEGLVDRTDIDVVVAHSIPETVVERIGGVRVKRLKRQFSFRGAPICLGYGAAIRESKADIVHLHLPNPAAVIALLWSRYSGPLVVTYHSDIVRQRFLGKLFEPVLRILLARCDAIIATSDAYASSSPTLKAFSSSCRVIPYGIDLALFVSPFPNKVAEIRTRYGKRIVLAVGRLIYYKGFDILIDAMKEIEAHLVIIGDGALRDSLSSQAKALGIADRVTFLGELQNEEIAVFYRAADVFVLPSVARSEAFGIVQIEAMASGTPVINTSLDSGVPSVSLDGLTGLTVPPRSVKALARAIRLLLDNPDLALRFGDAGGLRARERYSAERMCDDTLRLYSDIDSRRRASIQEVSLSDTTAGRISRTKVRNTQDRYAV
ncbi:MAG: glycosyltransferase [Gemmatimonadales bacterium]